ncbi:DNA-directed RNA polymerase subunit beta [Bacillus mangrovi]|uniref:DNA-directed RNA polymerase subunit beta n=1 Tax=Metabacillus mangrovi TaxID=1491830 RepID=A0A7X2S5V1_9BACI|nr:DNA-directed RNA polymerase subunit beta [Metabacillus mangrovi]MTH53977.1 DNA-directed RNA polymerase subunit beta [Metabacillus mangrovi]
MSSITREKYRQEKKTTDAAEEEKPVQKVRVRLIPIWLRLILVLIFFALAAICGAMIGYGVIGDGHPVDVLKPSTWQHIIDLVEKETE